MGVQGLWTLIEPCGRRVNIEALTNKRLAVGTPSESSLFDSYMIHQVVHLDIPHDLQSSNELERRSLSAVYKIVIYKYKSAGAQPSPLNSAKSQVCCCRCIHMAVPVHADNARCTRRDAAQRPHPGLLQAHLQVCPSASSQAEFDRPLDAPRQGVCFQDWGKPWGTSSLDSRMLP